MITRNEIICPAPIEQYGCTMPSMPGGPIVSVRSVNGMTGDVELKKLKFGDKEYNGSSEVWFKAEDLGLGKAFVFKTNVYTIKEAIRYMTYAGHGDVVYCKEDGLFYICLGEGEYRTFATSEALKDYCTIFEAASDVRLSVEKNNFDNNFRLLAQLFDKLGNELSKSSVNIPVASVIKHAYYIESSHKVAIVFDTPTMDVIYIPVNDLTGGLVTKDELEDDYYNKKEIDSQLDTKQDQLIAGNNIILENNVISAISKAEVEDEYWTVENPIGSLVTGDIIIRGTKLSEIIHKMITNPPKPSGLEIHFGGLENEPASAGDISKLASVIIIEVEDAIKRVELTFTGVEDKYAVFTFDPTVGKIKSIEQSGMACTDLFKSSVMDGIAFYWFMDPMLDDSATFKVTWEEVK